MLYNYCQDVGKLFRVLSNHGTQFTSNEWSRRLSEKGISLGYCSVHYPQGNPAERVIRELGRLLRTYSGTNHDTGSTGESPWKLLKKVALVSAVTQLISFPESLVVSYEQIVQAARKCLKKAGAARAAQMTRSSPATQFREGDLVLVKSNPI